MLKKLFGSVPGFRFSGHAGIKESLQVLDICISYNYRGKYKKNMITFDYKNRKQLLKPLPCLFADMSVNFLRIRFTCVIFILLSFGLPLVRM